MSYPINYPTPQSANIQIFNANNTKGFDWVKPQGATMVWFTLIGAGGNGNGYSAGGSGAVTNCMIPAFFIPDRLRINVPTSGDQNTPTTVVYQQKDGTGYTLLTANSGGVGTATAGNYFTAAGIYQSVVGAGSASGDNLTFLARADTGVGQYGYTTSSGGYFQMRPIICGVGGYGAGNGGIGCGGGISNGKGGAGMVVIISW